MRYDFAVMWFQEHCCSRALCHQHMQIMKAVKIEVNDQLFPCRV